MPQLELQAEEDTAHPHVRVEEEASVLTPAVTVRQGRVVSPWVLWPLNAMHWLLSAISFAFPLALLNLVFRSASSTIILAEHIRNREEIGISYPPDMETALMVTRISLLAGVFALMPWFVLTRLVKWLRPTTSLRTRICLFTAGVVLNGILFQFDPGGWIETLFGFR
jgi:hypothetical protein